MVFADFVRDERNRQKLTQHDLAVKAGISTNTLYLVEAWSKVRLETADKICRALGVTYTIGSDNK